MGSLFATPDQVRNPALRYYGGKFRLGGFIAKRFCAHTCYVEPFGGAAGVLLRKKPSPIEVYNDLDSAVYNFFLTLRTRRDELAEQLALTPFSRQEFDQSFTPSTEPLEEARRFFIQSWQSYGGPRRHKTTGWKIQREIWKDSRANQVAEWRGAIDNLQAVAARFDQVQLEHDDALKVIDRFDTPNTLFYLDPPYPSDTRNEHWSKRAYTFEFSSQDHVHLANTLNRIKGKAVISSYPNPLYDSLFADWHRVETRTQTMNKTLATEVLWMNYEPPQLSKRDVAASIVQNPPFGLI